MERKKILVVDDEPRNVKLLSLILKDKGFEVLTAYSSHECLDIVYRDSPDLILLDVIMPEINGIEVFKKIREDYSAREIPIIFLSAATDEDTSEFEEIKGEEFLHLFKPIDLDEVVDLIKLELARM